MLRATRLLQGTSVRASLCAAALIGVLAVATRAQERPAPANPEADVAAAVAEMGSAEPSEIFATSRGLDKLGTAGVAAARKAIAGASPRAVVGLARFLIAQNQRDAALPALERAVDGDDALAGVLAAELIQRSAKTRDDVHDLKAKLGTVKDPAVKIAVAKALRAKANDVDAERVLKDYLGSDDPQIRADAAFALAEVDNIALAKPVLNELAAEPTDRGKRAQTLLDEERLLEDLQKTGGLDPSGQAKLADKRIQELEAEVAALRKKVESGEGGGGEKGGDFKLLEELLSSVRKYYVDDGEKIEAKNLIDAAAKGMIGSLDPFSSYMTEKETNDFNDSMKGLYAGIGAVVSMDPKDKLLTIIRPIYSGPAYRTGLRSLDKITEVEGESTYGKTVEELVSKLKGMPQTIVHVKVYRRGWPKERDFTLKREEIPLKSVHYTMLPGKIGYLSLTQFGENAEQEVEAGLKELESQGMRALIFDLRSNPGGLLTAAVEISDKFLKGNRVIVASKGRNEFIAPRREFKTTDGSTHPDYPMVVLVNHASASASEIVSGALQDHHRATLVGENTFGKGSVQQLMKVKTTNDRSTLRLTIAKYYLPSGRCIHRDEKTGKGGVDPDIVVEADSDPAWTIYEADKLLEQNVVETYIQKLWSEHKDKVSQLAVFDDLDPSAYPGFDEFYTSIATRLDKGQVRKLVRAAARRLVQDDRAQEFVTDLEDDAQLQRGVYESLKKVGDDPAKFREYSSFAARFDRKPEAAQGTPAEGPGHPGKSAEGPTVR